MSLVWLYRRWHFQRHLLQISVISGWISGSDYLLRWELSMEAWGSTGSASQRAVSLLRSCLFEGETPPFVLPCLCESPKTLKYLRLTLPLCRSMATQVSSAPWWSQRHGLTGYALCSNLLILKFCKTNPIFFFLMLCIWYFDFQAFIDPQPTPSEPIWTGIAVNIMWQKHD